MPWRRMRLRGVDVFARTRDDGSLVVDRGRVEVRYRPGGRRYDASVHNLEPVEEARLWSDDEVAHARPDPSTSAASAEPHDGRLLVYADGACEGNPGPAGLGVVVVDGARTYELSEYLGRATNNVAELTAILRAAQRAGAEGRPADIRTDSQYAVGVLVGGWKARKNGALVQEVRNALARLPAYSLRHVRGHAGVALNERADRLARLAVETRRTLPWSPVPVADQSAPNARAASDNVTKR
ncbi:MAG: ribonuclease HI [Myxococcota bacterium]|nr:ribonuclease HI [Myxococcota bacterium]MDW8362149.1 ribonuclease H [Myxococcales bacterium]